MEEILQVRPHQDFVPPNSKTKKSLFAFLDLNHATSLAESAK